jgi:hypothetical protein
VSTYRFGSTVIKPPIMATMGNTDKVIHTVTGEEDDLDDLDGTTRQWLNFFFEF